MRKNPHFKLQIRSEIPTGWIGWSDARTQESAYEEVVNLPKKSEISEWFKEYAEKEGLRILWQVGFYWGTIDDQVRTHEFRVVRKSDETEVKL